MSGSGGPPVGVLKANLETLETFKKRVDILLTDLEGSAASPKEVREGTLKSAYLGTGFSEADSLFAAYNDVHDRLKQLSKTAADQIEAMSLLVHIANNDYQHVDDDQAAQLWAIQRTTERHYNAAQRDPSDPGQDKPQPEESTAGSEL